MLQVRVLSASFEDDRNTLALPALAVVDASVRRSIGKGVELFAAVQNVLGSPAVMLELARKVCTSVEVRTNSSVNSVGLRSISAREITRV